MRKVIRGALAWMWGGVWVVGMGCSGEAPPPPVQAPPRPTDLRNWPEAGPSQSAGAPAEPGWTVAAGGVQGGVWSLSPDGRHMAHVGAPAEENLVRVWDNAQGAWADEVALPAVLTAVSFLPDGQGKVLGTEDGSLWVVGGPGTPTPVKPGPCLPISRVVGNAEAGFVVTGPGGCLARYRAGVWQRAEGSSVSTPQDLQMLSGGGVAIAGAGVEGPAAEVWWPDGPPRPTTLADSVSGGGSQVEGVGPSLVKLALPPGALPLWSSLSVTAGGPVFLAAEGLALRAYDPTTGDPLTEVMPAERAQGVTDVRVSSDGLHYFLSNRDGFLIYGSTGVWDVVWRVVIPEAGENPRVLGLAGGRVAVLGKKVPQVLSVESFSASPSPPDTSHRPWTPLQVSFGNNGKALATTYASPSVGGTARWMVLWTGDMISPRRLELGTWEDNQTWEQFITTTSPSSPLASSADGSAFAAQGSREAQLVEAASGVRAGNMNSDKGRAVAFTGDPDELFLARQDGVAVRKIVGGDEDGVILAQYPQPVVGLSMSRESGILALAYGDETIGGIELMFPLLRRVVGRAKLPAAPVAIAIDGTGNRVLAAVPAKGLYQYPGGRQLVKPTGRGDKFTAVDVHQRSGKVIYAGPERSLYVLEGGKPRRFAIPGGQVWDVAWHPSGLCVAVALATGRVEIWGKDGMALAFEMWEGGQWVAWTAAGKAMGDGERVQALRVSQPGGTPALPLPMGNDELITAWRQACDKNPNLPL